MSLPHALLTALIDRPDSGSELASRFDRSLGHFWAATHQQIYRELDRLATAGLISELPQEGPPRRGQPKRFAVTAAGPPRRLTRRFAATPSLSSWAACISAAMLMPPLARFLPVTGAQGRRSASE